MRVEVERLIAENKLSQAIQVMSDKISEYMTLFPTDADTKQRYSQLILISGRLNNTIQDLQKGVIRIDEVNLQKNQIRNSLLELLDSLGQDFHTHYKISLLQNRRLNKNENIVSVKNEVKTDYFTDSRDGHRYKIVEIGKQVWFAENMAYKAQKNCWAYNNDPQYVEKHGYLYTYETASIICPFGWHLPTDEEWKELELYIGFTPEEADKVNWRGRPHALKIKQKTSTDQSGVFNETGFSALFAGKKNWSGDDFAGIGTETYYWTDTNRESYGIYVRGLDHATGTIYRNLFNKNNAISVRYIKD